MLKGIFNKIKKIWNVEQPAVKTSYSNNTDTYQNIIGKNDAENLYLTGLKYHQGEGVKQDFVEAAKYYEKSANLGFDVAQCALAIMYLTDDYGFNVDYEKALKYFKLTANQGYAVALYNIGNMYYTGTGLSQNYSEALGYFKEAIKKDKSSELNPEELPYIAESAFNVGMIYYAGYGVPIDYKEASKWYAIAAAFHQPIAQFNLGSMYYKGRGVQQNFSKAFELFTKAANQDVTLAQCNLGIMYLKGEGCIADKNAALKWLQIAAQKGDTLAQQYISLFF